MFTLLWIIIYVFAILLCIIIHMFTLHAHSRVHTIDHM